jgi:uncharacterized membrane protein YvbJ
MARAPAEIAEQVVEATRGDTAAVRAIAEAVQSRDQQRIKSVLKESAGVDVTDEEINNALQETDDVTAYFPT